MLYDKYKAYNAKIAHYTLFGAFFIFMVLSLKCMLLCINALRLVIVKYCCYL